MSACHPVTNSCSERAATSSRSGAAPAVVTDTFVIVGSDTELAVRHTGDSRDPVTTTSSTNPSTMSVSNAARDDSVGSMRASTRKVVAATSGPRRSIPPAVTNLVVRPDCTALCTRLAAAVTPRSKFSRLPWEPGAASNTTVHWCRPSTVCSLTIRSSVRADARQWIDRRSKGPSVVLLTCGLKRRNGTTP